jgi:hypothetical protein
MGGTAQRSQLEIRPWAAADPRYAPGTVRFEFMLGGVPLSSMLGTDRDSLVWCGFDLDLIVVDKERFPNYDRAHVVRSTVRRYLGLEAPANQFRSDSIVVYRCHCGSDYCGVISLRLELTGDEARWRNIGYEDDDGDAPDHQPDVPSRISIVRFELNQYRLAFQHFIRDHLDPWVQAGAEDSEKV